MQLYEVVPIEADEEVDIFVDHSHNSQTALEEDNDEPGWYPPTDHKFGKYSITAKLVKRTPQETRSLIDDIVRPMNLHDFVADQSIPPTTCPGDTELFDRMVYSHDQERKHFDKVEAMAVNELAGLMGQVDDNYRVKRQLLPRLREIFTDANGQVLPVHIQLPRTRQGKDGMKAMPGQRSGLAFIMDQDEVIGGGLLADEPGVGKTMEIFMHIRGHRFKQMAKAPADRSPRS